jgi:hypothetical protein
VAFRVVVGIGILLGSMATASAQTFSHRGFVEAMGIAFPQRAPNDRNRGIADVTVREEAFVRPAPWVQFGGGLELRANTYDQVEQGWRLDISDRGQRRPRLSVRRLAATLARGPFTVEVGKQFIRWGKTDIVNPTDRFAPRDFLNVIDSEFLGVTAVRGTAQLGDHTFEVVWSPRFTPSRIPLGTQRWAVVPPDLPPLPIVEGAAVFPRRSQSGGRWGYVGSRFEYSLAFFDGFNHLPDIAISTIGPPVVPLPQVDVRRVYPRIRVYGTDAVVPTRWITAKAEAAYFTSPTRTSDEYLLYVMQVERQVGEWLFAGGYVGDWTRRQRTVLTFAPDRGVSRAFIARVVHTMGPTRRLEFEGVARQNGAGAYGRIEFSQTYGNHWRGTLSAIGIGGRSDDFLGQYRRNSQVRLTVRYSF